MQVFLVVLIVVSAFSVRNGVDALLTGPRSSVSFWFMLATSSGLTAIVAAIWESSR